MRIGGDGFEDEGEFARGVVLTDSPEFHDADEPYPACHPGE
jgi:hypothetical protein